MDQKTFAEINEFIACNALFTEFKKSQDKEAIYRVASRMLDDGTLSHESYNSIIDIVNNYKTVESVENLTDIDLLSHSTITSDEEDLQSDLQNLKDAYNNWKTLNEQFVEKYDITNISNEMNTKYFN